MIPAIDDEPNLRLLSLQHNLINVFHVPLETEPSDDVMSIIAEVPSPPPKEMPVQQQQVSRHLSRQLSRQRSITSASGNRNQLYLGWSAKSGRNTPQPTPPPPPTSNQPTFLQKPLLLNAQPKHILRKSNSFIQNYPNLYTTNTNKTNNQFTMSTNNFTITARNKLVRTPSFSVENLISSNNNINSNTNNSNGTTVHHNGNVVEESSLVEKQQAVGLIESPRIEVKHNLGNLVFLDLYDNQIETITNLDGLKSLTVLLLGKNRITDISGLMSVKQTLRVLDLHGNKISSISLKISALQELKSLNLAGNLLKQINDKDFSNLFSLKELNLKRNKLRKIVGFDDLRSLERLWLCHNELQRVEDMCTIARAINLKEVTIENNPVSLAGDCASFLVSYLPNLVSLSQMQITEQVRRAAAAWRKNKEASDSSYLHLTTDVCMNMRREEIISNARTNWELLRGQPIPKGKMQIDKLDLFRPNTAGLKAVGVKVKKGGKKPLKPTSRDNSVTSEQGGEDYFRLPPILAPFIDQQKDFTNSTSSLGPNVDSGSSLYSSDNEDKDKAKGTLEASQPTSLTPPSVVEDSKVIEVEVVDEATVASPKIKEIFLEKPELVSIPIQELSLPLNATNTVIDDVSQVDKQSNISTASIKSGESIVTNISSSERAEKCKSAAPRRQNTTTSISSRAQTAKVSNNVTNAGEYSFMTSSLVLLKFVRRRCYR